MLKFGSQEIPVYCHMGDFGCGDGGWTLAMKIDGAKVCNSISSLLCMTCNLKWQTAVRLTHSYCISENIPL